LNQLVEQPVEPIEPTLLLLFSAYYAARLVKGLAEALELASSVVEPTSAEGFPGSLLFPAASVEMELFELVEGALRPKAPYAPV
jgi:hypothetical protein